MLVTDLLLNAPSISNVPNVREEDVAGVVGGVQLVTWPEGGVMNMKLRVKRLKKTKIGMGTSQLEMLRRWRNVERP